MVSVGDRPRNAASADCGQPRAGRNLVCWPGRRFGADSSSQADPVGRGWLVQINLSYCRAMDEQPDIDLDFALVDLGLQDPRLANLAGAAIRVLTGDGGLEALTQQALQSFVWYELPCEYGGTAETKLALIAALGRLFERLRVFPHPGGGPP